MEHLVRRRMLAALVVMVLVAGCGGSAGSPSSSSGSAGTDPTALPHGAGPASAEPTSPTPPAESAGPSTESSPTPPPMPAVVLASGKVARSEVARAPATTARAKEAAASITSFGIDLYRQMLADGTLKAKENAVFSPTSIALALGMARAGAKGATADQMDAVLHTTGWGALGKGLNALEQALSSRNATWKARSRNPMTAVEGTQSVALRIANAAFAQRDWAIVREYLDRIAATFGAGLRLVDYEGNPEASRRAINAWVKRRTAGRIPELIPREPQLITPLTRLVLVNAIYLKAEWQIELSDARPRTFDRLDGSSIRVPTMYLWGGQEVPYATGKGWQATELRYLAADRKRPLAMTLVLPDDLAALEEGLTAAKVGRIVAKLDEERVLLRRVSWPGGSGDGCMGTYAYSLQLFMPRFSVDTAAALRRPLAALGMPLAFERGVADFSGIHVPESPYELLYVGEVIHQANIDVDEKGTEAAAATAVIGVATGGGCYHEPRREITLRLNRPFLFVLRDVETGAILFMGRVVDPSQK